MYLLLPIHPHTHRKGIGVEWSGGLRFFHLVHIHLRARRHTHTHTHMPADTNRSGPHVYSWLNCIISLEGRTLVKSNSWPNGKEGIFHVFRVTRASIKFHAGMIYIASGKTHSNRNQWNACWHGSSAMSIPLRKRDRAKSFLASKTEHVHFYLAVFFCLLLRGAGEPF